jgi:hypothetical protein
MSQAKAPSLSLGGGCSCGAIRYLVRHLVGTTGIPTRFWFCATCGGRICGERDGRGRVNLRAGTLDDTSWLMPLAHHCVRSAQPWEGVAGDAAAVATLPSETASCRL